MSKQRAQKKNTKTSKNENLKKNLKFLIKFFFPFFRPQQTIPPKCSSGSYYIAGPSRKREISHCKNLKMDPQKALVQSTIYSHLSYIVLTQLVTLRVAELGHPKSPILLSKGENVHRPEAIHPYQTKRNTTFQEQGQKFKKLKKCENYL